MYLIIFIALTTILTVIFYKVNQGSNLSDWFGSFFASIGVQVVFFGMSGLCYGLYMLKPL